MPDSVSGTGGHTVSVPAELVARAAEFAAGAGIGVERVLGSACAALVARFRRVDDDVLDGGIGRGAGVPVELLPDGRALLAAGPLPGEVAAALDACVGPFTVAALKESERALGDVESVGDAEWARLTAWSYGERVAVDEPVHRMFVARAREMPDAVAVSDGEVSLTYRQLLGVAGGIARELGGRAVAAGEPVGVLFDRGTDAVAARVAVALAGATAVPLDPDYPDPRLRLMLAETGVRLTLTCAALAGRVPSGEAVAVDGVAPSDDVPERGDPEVAAVLFTSGSTGRPKGVRITHRAIARLVRDRHVDFGPDDAVLCLAPAAFDASLLEVWGALARGARLEVAPAGPLGLRDLADLVRERGITAAWLTAGLFHQMAEFEPDCFAGVRRLFTGGDVVSPHHTGALLARHPGLGVVNGYGPTENTTFTCCHLLTAAPPAGAARVPIGTPVANTRVFVVDRRGHPVPAGVPGELWAAGDGLAAGYLGLPELTGERFPVPSSGLLAGTRCYRTGDLARFLPDGTLDFLGREDGQVKINGHRVEPGEIERAVLAVPGVRDVCVVPETDPMGGRRLAAHLVGDGGNLARTVRAALRGVLPGYLLPARYAVADSLPLTANGKIDRVRLSAGESET